MLCSSRVALLATMFSDQLITEKLFLAASVSSSIAYAEILLPVYLRVYEIVIFIMHTLTHYEYRIYLSQFSMMNIKCFFFFILRRRIRQHL